MGFQEIRCDLTGVTQNVEDTYLDFSCQNEMLFILLYIKGNRMVKSYFNDPLVWVFCLFWFIMFCLFSALPNISIPSLTMNM